ncbi:MAG: XdhC family aldehyde oxidoreductase maturation factor [Smithella sp.]
MLQTDSLRHPLQLYQYIHECLLRQESISLATVISRSGSGPREVGASIVVTPGRKTMGTIGGGILEAKVMEMAASAISNHRAECRTFFLTEDEVSENGMICGGQVEILVDYLDGAHPAVMEIIDALLHSEKERHTCWLVRSIRQTENTSNIETGLGLMDEKGCTMGSLYTAHLDMEVFRQQYRKKEPSLIRYGDARYFVHQIDPPETVFIFGAGHIGQELAALCTFAGFRTVVIDDRQEFANQERFPAADEIIVLNSFYNSLSELKINTSAYLVIATRGHAYDQHVLSKVLKTSSRYIGMIASRRKREIIFQFLLNNGFSGEDLADIHSPVGLDIGARTPAEIAVSIVAELIAVRAGREKRKTGQNNDKL